MNKAMSKENTAAGGSALEIFNRLNEAYLQQPYMPFEQRKQVLKAIEEILTNNDEAICDAVCKDFGNRSVHETRILEIAPTILGARYTLKHLKSWMKPQKRHVSKLFFGGKNTVIPQPKGVVGIITPWNYPLQLSISPLTSAIAAGNRVMIKLASNSQTLAQLLKKLFAEKVSEDLVTFLPGVKASEFSSLPFHHLIFTGSPLVGRTIMEMASRHLTPVTLELGGKSPTILGEDFDLKTAAERIMYSKLINSGQMCVAPDYIFVPESKADGFVEEVRKITQHRYPSIASKDYTSIIDEKAFKRLQETLDDAAAKNAELIPLVEGEKADPSKRKLPPFIVRKVSEEMRIMQEEIFGPYLPLMTYQSIDEVIEYINRRERPLALYIYSNNKAFQQKILMNTISGGVTINDCTMHVAQHDMPFGGIGNSGMGQYHGYEGFAELSKLRPVFQQAKIAIALAPPYGKTFDRIYNSVKKFKWLT